MALRSCNSPALARLFFTVYTTDKDIIERKIKVMNQVLLIDDEKDFCLLMKGQMEKKQIGFQCAHTLKEGVEKVAAVNPDVLLLDNHLPDGSGWREAAKIQKQFPNLRIILISALAHPGYEETGIGLHFTRVAKPLSLQDIQRYVS